MLKQVLAKWETEGQLAVIYRVDNLLLFYTKEKDPHFIRMEAISLERARETNPYKAIKYSKESVPSDAYISVVWEWGYFE